MRLSPNIAAAATVLMLILMPVLWAVPADAGPARPMISAHRLEVAVDIEKRTVEGTDEITVSWPEDVAAPPKLKLYIWKDALIDRIEYRAQDVPFTAMELSEESSSEITVRLPPLAKDEAAGRTQTLTLRFHGEFPPVKSAMDNIRRGVAFLDEGVIGPEGALLLSTSLWYPQEAVELAVFDMTVTVPGEYTPVAEGELVEERTGDGSRTVRWRTSAPVDGVNLVVGKYIVTRETHKGVDLYTYFFEDDPELTRLYLDKTREYLDLHSETFGPYPFRKFAVVENFLPTGLGMPTYTLLGSRVLRLPFIPDTSLGHEIAHNWWGNSVYIDLEKGNWVEALTTYTADYAYARRESPDKARDFRIRNLMGYKNYAGSGGVPLGEFNDSENPASRAVGYNKGFMVFNMLEQYLGADDFTEGLRTFYRDNAFSKASWEDLRRAFEKAAGEDLGWFFTQWLERSGGPRISLGAVSAGDTSVTLEITQAGEPYRLVLPVEIDTGAGAVRREVVVEGSDSTVTVGGLPSRPVAVAVDPDYETFRILADEEVPPTLGGCFGARDGVVVLPNRRRIQERYFKVADTLRRDFGFVITTDAEMGRKDYLGDKTLFIMGWPDENKLTAMVRPSLEGKVTLSGRSFTVDGVTYGRNEAVGAMAVKNPHTPARAMCIFLGSTDSGKTMNAGERIRYYSQKSYAVFGEGEAPVNGMFDVENTLVWPSARDRAGAGN